MNWTENWPTVLMSASVFLFIGTLFAVLRFLRNAADPQDGLEWPAEEDLEETGTDGRRSTRGSIPVGVLAIMVAMAVSYGAFAHRPDRDRVLPPDGVSWTAEALLRDFFPSSERVAYQQISLTPKEQAQLAALTLAERENPMQVLYLARTGARIDGYAFLSETDSKKDPAAFGVRLSVKGRVIRVEVMRLLDPDQQEVLDSKFLRQFRGRALPDAPRLHRVDRPAGCTSACRDATQTVARALFLVSKTRAALSPETAPPSASEER